MSKHQCRKVAQQRKIVCHSFILVAIFLISFTSGILMVTSLSLSDFGPVKKLSWNICISDWYSLGRTALSEGLSHSVMVTTTDGTGAIRQSHDSVNQCISKRTQR
ncbi:hypothetical protein C8R48DRAFT_705791 [Suillus tomentosus]|nr:hypothetical protein C8R48DRAFT_705791 [Suillus tomentosus]